MAKFTNRYYENSHGKSPRGYGQWGFVELRDEYDWISDETVVFVEGSMTLTEAKRAVRLLRPEVKWWAVAS